MGILQKFLSLIKKDVVIEGGFEMLPRITGRELGRDNFIGQYEKSLYVYACISKIAMKVASIEFQMYRVINSRGDIKEVMTHQALDLLYRVNPFQTKTEFLEVTMINLKTTGDAFWYKVRNKGGRVVELWNLRPDFVTIVSDPTNFIKQYEFSKSDGTKEIFVPEDVIHLKYPDPLSLYLGLSPLAPAQARVQTEQYATEYQRNFFINSARPDAVIKNKTSTLTKDQKEEIREGWSKRHQGARNSGRPAVLTGDLEYQQISLSQREMDFMESMKFTRDDILVAFQVPKPIVAIVDDVNRANSETAMHIFLSETIKPEMQRLVEKINEELIYPDFGDEFYIAFKDPTPDNREVVMKEYESGLMNNYLLINEVRQKEGLPPLKGGWSFYMPAMNVPVGGLASEDQSAAKAKAKEIHISLPEADRKQKAVRFNFKGHGNLLRKFLIREELESAVVKSFEKKPATKKKVKKTIKKKSVAKSLLKDEEVKKIWHEMINKKADIETVTLKNATDKFFEDQKKRALENFDKKKTLETKLKGTDIIKVGKEEKLAATFILPFVEDFMKQSGEDTLSHLAPQEDWTSTASLQKIIKERAEQFASDITATTVEKVSATLAEGISAGEGITELRNRVEEKFNEFPLYRSELIARTEATYANNKGTLEGFRQSGVANAKEWINSGDDRVREEHENGIGVGGEIVGLDDEFSNGLQQPDEPNCRCVLGPAFIED